MECSAPPNSHQHGFNAGLTDFMTKPIDGHALAGRPVETARQVTEQIDSAFDRDQLEKTAVAASTALGRRVSDGARVSSINT